MKSEREKSCQLIMVKLGEKFMIFVILTHIGLKVQSKRSEVLDEDVMNRIQAKAKLITEKEGFKAEVNDTKEEVRRLKC